MVVACQTALQTILPTLTDREKLASLGRLLWDQACQLQSCYGEVLTRRTIASEAVRRRVLP